MSFKDVGRFEAAAGVLLDELGYERANPSVVPIVQEHAATVRTTLTKKFPDLFSPLENK
jgi:hypothetical protein